MYRLRGFAAGVITSVVIIVVAAVCAMIGLSGIVEKNTAVNTDENNAVVLDKENTEENVETTVSNGLHKNAVFTYEFYNEITDTTDSMEGMCPDELVGKTMTDVKDYYSDWQVIEFSPDSVLLRKIIGSKDEERYVVGVYDGCVAVFYENEEDGIYMTTDIPVAGLDHDRQVMLNDGIYVEGRDRLGRIIEDYSS